NQLGRRNINARTANYLRGRLYLERKRQGRRTDRTSGHSDQKLTTSEQMAAEYKVAEATIRRDARFAQHVNGLVAHCGEEVKGFIFSRDSRLARKDIRRWAEQNADEQRRWFQTLVNEGTLPEPSSTEAGGKAASPRSPSGGGRPTRQPVTR